jgi:DNA uptake protein ComE-like DNA-binding protein
MFRRMLRAYLSLTRGERNGFILLALLILALLAGRILVPLPVGRPAPDFSGSDSAFHRFLSDLNAAERRESPAGKKQDGKVDSPNPPRSPIRYFDFDPNQVTYAELRELGLPDGVARTFIKYRKSGGTFRSKTDLLKVYGLGREAYARLEPHIHIPPAAPPAERKKESLLLELNSTDSLRLRELNGIGPVFARRIIRYRDLLGGFYETEQLKEVYGLEAGLYEQVVRQVYTDTSRLRRMDLNRVDRVTLLRHPYLTPYQADAIAAYGEFRGEWRDVNEIRQHQLVPDSVFLRIRPYLEVGK